jgi:uncharacterized protein
MARRIESLMIPGPAGRLEALLEEPEHGAAAQAALVCHPHPLHGGTMHTKVVHRLARGLRRAGCVVLRFNFRGVHRSEGEHDHGRGEAHDALAALAVLRERYPDLPYVLAGFSFGSRVVVRAASQLGAPAPRRLFIVGYPTTYKQHDLLARISLPRIFIHSTHDEHGPRKDLQALYDRLWEPKQIHWIEARDHFFTGALEAFERKVTELAR